MSTPPSPELLALDFLVRKADTARAELTRADVKAATLLTVTGTSFSVLAALALLLAGKLPVFAMVGIGGSVAGLGLSSTALLLVVLPILPPPGKGYGFTVLAGRDAADAAQMARESHTRLTEEVAEEAVGLADLAYRKHKKIRHATLVMVATLAVLTLTALALLVTQFT